MQETRHFMTSEVIDISLFCAKMLSDRFIYPPGAVPVITFSEPI